jgi:hypothetical protein
MEISTENEFSTAVLTNDGISSRERSPTIVRQRRALQRGWIAYAGIRNQGLPARRQNLRFSPSALRCVVCISTAASGISEGSGANQRHIFA